jgi:hypothetical protein
MLERNQKNRLSTKEVTPWLTRSRCADPNVPNGGPLRRATVRFGVLIEPEVQFEERRNPTQLVKGRFRTPPAVAFSFVDV